MDVSSPLVLIDSSYASIYRFHAVQKYFRLTHPKESAMLSEDYDWSANKEFVSKYKELFFNGLHKTLRKYRIPIANMIFAMDDAKDNLWRMSHLETYKQRKRSKRQKGLGTILNMVRDEIMPMLVEKHKVGQIWVEHLEADDVIAVLTRLVIEKKLFPSVVIITNDKDFVQLSHPDVTIINLQGKELLPTNYSDPRRELLLHVLCGDKSDNIQSCLARCDKRTVDKYIRNPALLQRLLRNPMIEDIYLRNRLLIDFDYIPADLQKSARRLFYDFYRAGRLPSNQIRIVEKQKHQQYQHRQRHYHGRKDH